MYKVRGVRVATFLTLLGLISSLLVATVAGASHGLVVSDFGTLDLVLDESSGDKFDFVPLSGPTVTEPLGIKQKCKADDNEPPESPDIAFLAATGNGNAFVGLRDHALGVKAQGEGNGEPCRRVNVGQSLTIGIDGTAELDDKFLDSGQIAASFKFNATMTVQRLLDGNPVGAQLTLSCTGSDCGPDSGLSDSDALAIPKETDINGHPVLFDAVVITTDGAVSVIDILGNPDLDTFFNVVEQFDGELDCGDQVDIGGAGELNGIFWRISNLPAESDPCDLKPFNASVSQAGDEITFIPAVGGSGQDFAAYIGRITSLPYADGPAQVTKQLFYDPLDGSGERVMEWCDVLSAGSLPAPWDDPLSGSPAEQTLANILGYVADPSNPGMEYPANPSGESWCLVRAETSPVPGDLIVSIFHVSGEGDPKFR